MRISKKNDYSDPQYHLCGNQLKAVSKLKLRISEFILLRTCHGVCRLTNAQVRQIVSLDSVGERCVLKFLSCFQNFMSLVRLILEYCYPVWCLHLKKDSNTLDKVQRRASKGALGNAGQDMPYGERVKLLKWPTLEQRILF